MLQPRRGWRAPPRRAPPQQAGPKYRPGTCCRSGPVISPCLTRQVRGTRDWRGGDGGQEATGVSRVYVLPLKRRYVQVCTHPMPDQEGRCRASRPWPMGGSTSAGGLGRRLSGECSCVRAQRRPSETRAETAVCVFDGQSAGVLGRDPAEMAMGGKREKKPCTPEVLRPGGCPMSACGLCTWQDTRVCTASTRPNP